jgi:hypothetical protein
MRTMVRCGPRSWRQVGEICHDGMVGERRDRRMPKPSARKQPAGQSTRRSRPRFSLPGSVAHRLMRFASGWQVSTDLTIAGSSPAGPTKHGGVAVW